MDIIISANKTFLNAMYSDAHAKAERSYIRSVFVYARQKADGTVLLYNTLYNSLVRLSDAEYKQFLECCAERSQTATEFIENGFWVPAAFDEKQRYIDAAHQFTLDFQRPLSVTITTTLRCNARCPYCYEAGVRQRDIAPRAVEHIVDFIKAKSTQNKVNINLFGGEPLLNAPFIRMLFERLKREEMAFSSYLITNGSLIDSEILNEFAEWNVENAQISLDGTANEYERRKRYIGSNGGMFQKVLDNIGLLLQHDVFVHIRLNISRENRDDILHLIPELDARFGGFENAVYYPAFLSGTANPLSEAEKIDFVARLLGTVKDPQKLTAGTKFYDAPRMHSCMIQDPFSFTIDVEGNIFYCEHLVGHSDKAIGNIFSNANFDDMRTSAPNLLTECSDCVFLPKCFGGCSSNRKNGDDPCMIEKYLISAYMELL